MNRYRRVIIAGIVFSICILLVAAGVQLFRLITKPQSTPRSHIVLLGYCSPKDIKPCIVSFSLDAENQMVVNILTPVDYADFYLTIQSDSEENKYECQKIEINVYCSGKPLYPGVPLHFSLVSTSTGQLFAKGDLTIIGLLLLPTPLATDTATPTETPTPFPPSLTPGTSYP